MKKRQIIIVGAGIAGLACARTLHDNKKKFTIITENIGGRILSSADGKINYGAYFVGKDYKHVLRFVQKGRKLHVLLHKGKSFIRLLQHPLQFLKLLFELYRFNAAYTKFKERCFTVSQKEAINENKYLAELYHKNAASFVREKNISDVMRVFAELIKGTMFTSLSNVSAFEFLHFGRYLFIPVYEFVLRKDKLIEGFERDIFYDSVISIQKQEKKYLIRTRNGDCYQANTIVLATPAHISKQLLHLKKIKGAVYAHMFHIRGKLKSNWKPDNLEGSHGAREVFAFAQQSDGTYLFYSKNAHPKFYRYFSQFQVIAKKHWNPAYFMEGNTLLDCQQDNNLYLIGDHNICGLEDAFITGMYTAKQLIRIKQI